MFVQKRQTIPNDAKFLTAGHLAYSGEIGDRTRQSEQKFPKCRDDGEVMVSPVSDNSSTEKPK